MSDIVDTLKISILVENAYTFIVFENLALEKIKNIFKSENTRNADVLKHGVVARCYKLHI